MIFVKYLKIKKMKYIIYIIPFGLVIELLTVLIVEFNKNKRFKKFKEIYPNEPFEKLTEYEEKSKINFSQKKDINDS